MPAHTGATAMSAAATADPLIDVRELRKWYPVRRGLLASFSGEKSRPYLKAVDGVSFSLARGEVLGLAGESGCGKSTTGMAVLQLLKPTAGQVLFNGTDVTQAADSRRMKTFRRRAQIVFQNPYESLNPRFTVERSVGEPVVIHFRESIDERRDRILRAMQRAGLVPAEAYLDRYPHQLSGGQLQRIAIARAISLEPDFLVADEPVSMLDVSIRAGILNLLRYFARDLTMAILYISHDLSTMRHVCSRVAIMYLGRIVEIGDTEQVLDRPRHPYAQALMTAVPVMGARRRQRVRLDGAVPNPIDLPGGCRFHTRCPKVSPRCREVEPALRPIDGGREVACHLYD
jgi:oligopeptide/dipeptide ABC transporter ATP-binding protein